MKPANPTWLGQFSINAKLAAMVAVFLGVLGSVMGLALLSFSVQSGVRAYVGGEGLWSNGQKDATYALTRYLRSGEPRDYRAFQEAIAIPLGDRAARLEMEQPVPDPAVVERGFVAGGIAAADVPDMIFLFRHFQQLAFFADAVEVWRQAERYVLELLDCGQQLHALIESGSLDPARRQQFAERIQRINSLVTPLEQRFSSVLGEGARETQALLLTSVLVISGLILTFGLWACWRIALDLRASIAGLREGAERFAGGDLDYRIPRRSADELGELSSAFNTMVAARRDAERELLDAHAFSDLVMENATNAIYALDTQGRFTLVNRRTCEISGYAREALLGRHFGALIHPDSLPALNLRYAAMIRGEGPILHYEVPLARPDGTRVYIMFSTAALERDGVIVGAVGAAEDITERRRADAELLARAEELARSNRELEQFAYVASHDLQEPLRTVSGFAELLARRYQQQLGPEADEYIGFITTGVRRMKSLIEDLLSYSRVSREPRAASEVDLNALLAAAKANLHAAISDSGASVHSERLPSLRADPAQLTQLFQNLLGNALKFRTAEPPRVDVSARQLDAAWQLSVRDHGIGIDPAGAERIFGLFQRLHTRDEYPGNGIGLTICKKIVDLHGGRIWAEPAAPGTVFHFTLPDQPA
ncbi:MAG: ATP-binding protein [Stagnimonas sp.]|nr:ATP-binding protein [Stagnimonas sp.]